MENEEKMWRRMRTFVWLTFDSLNGFSGGSPRLSSCCWRVNTRLVWATRPWCGVGKEATRRMTTVARQRGCSGRKYIPTECKEKDECYWKNDRTRPARVKTAVWCKRDQLLISLQIQKVNVQKKVARQLLIKVASRQWIKTNKQAPSK